MTSVLRLMDPGRRVVEGAFAATALETVAIGYAAPLAHLDRRGLVVADCSVVPQDGYARRDEGRFTLVPAYAASRVAEALDRDRALVIMHSHPMSEQLPQFSSIDDVMNEGLATSVLSQGERPFASLVWSSAGWSGALWEPGERAARALDLVTSVGEALILHQSCALPVDERFDRQVRAFGPDAQRALARIRIAVVGVGGTGSLQATWLARMGARDLVLVDADRVDRTNLSRLVGAEPDDVGRLKVEVLRDAIARISPGVAVRAMPLDVRECTALDAVLACDVVLCCTDSHSSRAVLARLPHQYGIPVIDVGTMIRPGGGAFADVRVSTPADACLDCLGVIDSERVTHESRQGTTRELSERRGYVPGIDLPAPSVLPLNAIASGVGLLRLLDLLAPWMDWRGRLTFDARTAEAIERPAQRRPGCLLCGSERALGAADLLPISCR